MRKILPFKRIFFLALVLLVHTFTFAQSTTLGSSHGSGSTAMGSGSGTGITTAGAAITGIQTSPNPINLNTGSSNTQQMGPTNYYSGFTGGTYGPACPTPGISAPGTWSSQNTGIATVNATGLVTAVAGGSTRIGCTAPNPNGGVNLQFFPLVCVFGIPEFTTPPVTCTAGSLPLPGGTVGVVYPTFTFVVCCGTSPYSGTVTSGSLPSGLTLTWPNLSGTPNSGSQGNYTFTITATDNASHSNPQTFTLSISANSCAPPNFCASTTLTTVAPPAGIDWGGAVNTGVTFLDTSYPSGTPSLVGRCTDQNTRPDTSLLSSQAGLGGFADNLSSDVNDALVMGETAGAGAQFIMPFNTSGSTPSCGQAITQNKSSICPTTNGNANCSPNSTEDFGPGAFSVNTGGLFTVVGPTTDNLANAAITQYTISPTSAIGSCTTPPCYSYSNLGDMSCGLPINIAAYAPACQNAPAYAPNTSYPPGAYVSFTITPATWAPSTPFAIGDIIISSSTCAFKATVDGGVTGSGSFSTLQTALNAACAVPRNLQTVTDNNQKWKFIGSGPVFILQNVGTTGTSSASAPCNGFLNSQTSTTQMPNGHPDILFTCNDGANLIWENVGPNSLPQWKSFGGAGLNDNRISSGFSNNTYGNKYQPNGGTCPTPPAATKTCVLKNYSQSGDQNTGLWNVVWDQPTNVFKTYNSVTKYQSTSTCTGGTGSTCGPTGTTVLNPDGKDTQDTCGDFIHSMKSPYGNFVLVGRATSGVIGTCGSGPWIWRPFQTFNSLTSVVAVQFGDNHWAMDFNNLFIFGDCGLSLTIGIFDCYVPMASITTTPPVTFEVLPCGGSGQPPCTLKNAIDTHTGRQYNPSQADSLPAIGAGYNLANFDNQNPFMFGQGEWIGVTTTPTIASPYGSATGTLYRFTHLPCWMTNNQFSIMFLIGQESQKGDYGWVSCDGMGTFGTNDGTATVVCSPSFPAGCPGPPAGTFVKYITNNWVVPVVPIGNDPTPRCVGGRVHYTSFAYVVGNVFQPIVSTNSGGNYDAFQIIVAGTSASSVTSTLTNAWKTSTLGTVITDGGAQYQDIGPGNCKGEILWIQQK